MLFTPPPQLQKVVDSAGGKPLNPRDTFIKRVAAVGGDDVELLPSGGIAVNGVARKLPSRACSVEDERPAPSTNPTTRSRVIPDGTLFVLGDCPAKSTDSRTWGPLPVQNVVARPFVRIWPVGRQGAVDPV